MRNDRDAGSPCKSISYADICCRRADLRWGKCSGFADKFKQYAGDQRHLVASDG